MEVTGDDAKRVVQLRGIMIPLAIKLKLTCASTSASTSISTDASEDIECLC